MPDSLHFAAVDLGSNSFHLLIAREKQGSLEIVDRIKDMVQIARGLDADGNLSAETQQRALRCLTRFGERLRQVPHLCVQAVGTKTLRTANNAKQFLHHAEAALGHPIRVIPGREEARLVYMGVSHCIAADQRQRLVIDIGGGSTELIIGQHHKPRHLESLGIGCVALAKDYLDTEGITPQSMRKVYQTACEALRSIRAAYLSTGWDVAVGASGTMRVIAELLPQGTGTAVITAKNLDSLIEQTIEDGEVVASDIPKLRRDVLPAGLMILKGIFTQLELSELYVVEATLKEGLIYEALKNNNRTSKRLRLPDPQ